MSQLLTERLGRKRPTLYGTAKDALVAASQPAATMETPKSDCISGRIGVKTKRPAVGTTNAHIASRTATKCGFTA